MDNAEAPGPSSLDLERLDGRLYVLVLDGISAAFEAAGLRGQDQVALVYAVRDGRDPGQQFDNDAVGVAKVNRALVATVDGAGVGDALGR